MDSVLSVLSPENIQKNEYEEIIRDIRSQLQSLSDSRRFRQLLDKYADKPYYFKRNGNYLENKRCTPTIRDAACFYVLIKYLEYYKLKKTIPTIWRKFSQTAVLMPESITWNSLAMTGTKKSSSFIVSYAMNPI